MDPIREHEERLTRRHFFRRATLGLGVPALASLLGPAAFAGDTSPAPRLPRVPHHAPTAKRAIFLFMAGAPAQHDMLDYKPKLAELYDTDLPESIRQGQRLTTMTSGQDRFPIAPTIYQFQQYGRSRAWVSELLPRFAGVVDEVAIVRSMFTEAINHDPAITYITTGSQLPGKASLGAWLSYGLGSANQELPAFVVLTSSWTGRQDAQALYNRLWGSGFLPTQHQGVALRGGDDPVLFLSDPAGLPRRLRRQMLDSLARMNARHQSEHGDPETLARIAQYEMAYKMQSSVPELTDLSGEPDSIFELYGPDSRKPGTFAHHCLLARRMAERGVRFSQIFHRGWDQHGNLTGDLPRQCQDIDQPMAALVLDLKQRGMLDDTLVIWSGEFGRTAYCQGKLTRENYGRDHHPRCFTSWLAGGGIRPGIVHGETDDFGYNIVRDPVHIRDLNATILHCLGIDHIRLTYPFQGLDQRLTGVERIHSPDGQVLRDRPRLVTEILA